MDAAWLLLMLGGTVLWHGARHPAPKQTPSLTIALTVAAFEAARRGHAEVAPEHLVFAALFAIEQAAEKDLSHVREAIETNLAELPTREQGAPIDPAAVELSSALLDAVRRASVPAMRAVRPLALRDVLDAVSVNLRIAVLVNAAFAAPDPIPSAPESARIIMGTPYRAPPDDRADVVLWNDDESPLDGVRDVVRESFAKSEPEVLHLVLTAHYMGRATVGRYPWEEAKARVFDATTRARKNGMPLRMTFAPPGQTPEIKKTRLADRVRRLFAKSA